MVTFGTYSSNHLVLIDHHGRPPLILKWWNQELIQWTRKDVEELSNVNRAQNSCSLGGEKPSSPMSNHLQAVVLGENWIQMIEFWMKLNHIMKYSWLVLLWVGKVDFYPQNIITPEISPGIRFVSSVGCEWCCFDPAFRPPWWVEFCSKSRVDGSRWLHWGFPKNMLNIYIFCMANPTKKIMRMFF